MKILFSEIEKIWNNSRRSGNLNMDVNLVYIKVLGGTNGKGKLNQVERNAIVKLTAKFVRQTRRKP